MVKACFTYDFEFDNDSVKDTVGSKNFLEYFTDDGTDGKIMWDFVISIVECDEAIKYLTNRIDEFVSTDPEFLKNCKELQDWQTPEDVVCNTIKYCLDANYDTISSITGYKEGWLREKDIENDDDN